MKSVLKLGLAALLATTPAFSANATGSRTFACRTGVPATHPVHTMGMAEWVESISEASNGRIAITVYPGQQLGAAPTTTTWRATVSPTLTYTNPGYQAGRFPIYLAWPRSPFHGNNATDGAAALHEWYEPSPRPRCRTSISA